METVRITKGKILEWFVLIVIVSYLPIKARIKGREESMTKNIDWSIIIKINNGRSPAWTRTPPWKRLAANTRSGVRFPLLPLAFLCSSIGRASGCGKIAALVGNYKMETSLSRGNLLNGNPELKSRNTFECRDFTRSIYVLNWIWWRESPDHKQR